MKERSSVRNEYGYLYYYLEIGVDQKIVEDFCNSIHRIISFLKYYLGKITLKMF